MLSRSRSLLLKGLRPYCGNRGFLFSETQLNDILSKAKCKNGAEALKELQKQQFIDIIYTDKRGERYVFIDFLPRGNDYFIQRTRRRRELLTRLTFASLSAIITYFFGRILILIFS